MIRAESLRRVVARPGTEGQVSDRHCDRDRHGPGQSLFQVSSTAGPVSRGRLR